MSRELSFLQLEVEKIFLKTTEYPMPLNIAMALTYIASFYNGVNLTVLKLDKLTSLASYFVLADFTSFVSMKSCAVAMKSEYHRYFQNIMRSEGLDADIDWILLDSGDVIVHLFKDYSREYYELEERWKDAERISIPESFYSLSSDSKTNSSQNNTLEETSENTLSHHNKKNFF